MNALDVATLTELRDRLRELADDDEARVVILTGAGEKAFVAGADIKYMSGLDVDQAKEGPGVRLGGRSGGSFFQERAPAAAARAAAEPFSGRVPAFRAGVEDGCRLGHMAILGSTSDGAEGTCENRCGWRPRSSPSRSGPI